MSGVSRKSYTRGDQDSVMDLSGVREHAPVPILDARKRAAVLAPVIDRDGEHHLLFTKRAQDLGEHPGQMSFPGGGWEPNDPGLRETALREAREEIDLDPSTATITGRLDDILTTSGYAVRPFVGSIPDRRYEPDQNEVAEIAIFPISELVDMDNYESEHREYPDYGTIRVHYFRVDGYTIWGATGRMLVQLLELTTDWEPPEEPDRVVDADAEYLL